ncbi:helix-turn-helix domain-containing protein [Cohnella sp. AR92]|uniref:winged helix-turn-helix transcriptional regulator n=1 Tax=Cohnella sp. AR92 TaxID=648716 RepID=UPI000F8EA379|nr:helix-turn-helix domain-containing protein [Cohnella sp. AR92]RUS45932.1 transcriptional regulator [Cohnella sp. AR92]
MDYTKMCSKYESAAELLGKKWTGLIIRVMMGGPKRFKEIKEQIPDMSDKMLTDRMKELESHGVVKRTVYPEMPVRIEYELTDKGRDLEGVTNSIQAWGEKWL